VVPGVKPVRLKLPNRFTSSVVWFSTAADAPQDKVVTAGWEVNHSMFAVVALTLCRVGPSRRRSSSRGMSRREVPNGFPAMPPPRNGTGLINVTELPSATNSGAISRAARS